MTVFLLVFTIVAALFLLLWIPLLGVGIYQLKKYGSKPAGIIMSVLGGIWGMGALAVAGLALIIYYQFQAYSVPAFDPATHDGPLGKIKFPFSSEISLSVADSKGYAITAENDGDYVELPVGNYYISSCSFKKKNENGNPWNLRIYPTTYSNFEITEGEATELNLGPPITTSIESRKSGGDRFVLSLKSQDKNGNNALLSGYGAGKTKFQILSMDDKILKEGNFEYG